MTLTIHGPMTHASGSVEITTEGAERARLTFNPSGNKRVDRIKTIVAALYSEIGEIAKLAREQKNDVAGREAATAMTQIQSGAMFAVSAATEKSLYDGRTGDPQAGKPEPSAKPTDELPVVQEGASLSSATSAKREEATGEQVTEPAVPEGAPPAPPVTVNPDELPRSKHPAAPADINHDLSDLMGDPVPNPSTQVVEELPKQPEDL